MTNHDNHPKHTQQGITGNKQQGNDSYLQNENCHGDDHQRGTNSYYCMNSNHNYGGRTWENTYTNHMCNNCGERGHFWKDCTKSDPYCSWCHTRTNDTAAFRSKPKSTSTPLKSPSGVNYHPTHHPDGTTAPYSLWSPTKLLVPTTSHSHPQYHPLLTKTYPRCWWPG